MKKQTIGKIYNKGAVRDIYYEENEPFDGLRQAEECYLLIFISSGSCILKINNMQQIVAAPCLICLGEKELVSLVEERDLLAESIYVHPKFLNNRLDFSYMYNTNFDNIADRHDRFLFAPFVKRDINNNGIIQLDPITALRVKEVMRCAGEELRVQRDGYWSCRTRSYFMELLFLLERIRGRQNETSIIVAESSIFSEEYSDIQKVLLYIHNNYQKKINVKEMVDIFSTNKTTLSKRFKEATNYTIIQYTNLYRIKIARLMLVRTNLSIDEVSCRLGFSDNTHFIRVFKIQETLTPLQFRNKYRVKRQKSLPATE